MKVGFVGLGQMGSGMAASLLKAGHEVIVYNRTPAKAEPLIAQGARAAASIAEACREGAVVTMLANDNAVEGVVLGKGGIIDTLPKGGDPHLLEHDQCRAVGGARDGACESRPAFRRGAGLWAPGRRCGR